MFRPVENFLTSLRSLSHLAIWLVENRNKMLVCLWWRQHIRFLDLQITTIIVDYNILQSKISLVFTNYGAVAREEAITQNIQVIRVGEYRSFWFRLLSNPKVTNTKLTRVTGRAIRPYSLLLMNNWWCKCHLCFAAACSLSYGEQAKTNGWSWCYRSSSPGICGFFPISQLRDVDARLLFHFLDNTFAENHEDISKIVTIWKARGRWMAVHKAVYSFQWNQVQKHASNHEGNVFCWEREREGEMDGKEWKFSDVCIVYYIFFLFFFILSNKEKGDLRLLVKERTITRGAIFFWGAEELIYVQMRTMDCLYQSSNCKIHWNYYFLENKHTFCCLICQTCKKKTHWNFARERIVRIKILSTACWKILFCWKNSRAHTHTLKKLLVKRPSSRSNKSDQSCCAQ